MNTGVTRSREMTPENPEGKGHLKHRDGRTVFGTEPVLRCVFVLTDGIRGHENQSLGIASWLSDLGATVNVFPIPRLEGFRRFLNLKVTSGRLMGKNPRQCTKWLEASGGKALFEEIQGSLQRSGTDEKDVLFLSAGSAAAPYCLALACVMGGKSCTVMTPSVLVTTPFDFAVVPEHDQPEPADNVLATLGAPNMIRPELLEREKAILERRFPPVRPKRWGLLLGGDDKNYHIGPEWVERLTKTLQAEASTSDADIYITTSRRTLPETEHLLKQAVSGNENIRMLLFASENEWNPVPGILGLCDNILCTEDSVSMISEAATAGHRPLVLRVERKATMAAWAAKVAALFADKEFFDEKHLFGAPKFERMIRSFETRELCRYIEELEGVRETLERDAGGPADGFNEARRAAEWITKRWDQ